MEYSWADYLNPDEKSILKEVEEWMSTRPGMVGRLFGLAGKPLDYAFSKIPQSIQDAINKAVLTALTTMRDGTAGLVSRKKIYGRIEDLAGPLKGAGGLLRVNVRLIDRVARDLMTTNTNLCTAEGAVAGAAGLPGLAADIPALYGLLFKQIQEVATCYAFSVKPPRERDYILKILDIGHHLSCDKKKSGMAELESSQDMIRKGIPVQDMERYAVNTMAKQFATALMRRKLAQSAFVVGSLVGAGVNRMMATDVGEVAFMAYRRRFLMEVALLRMG